jgi:hypothetical protein
MKQSTLLSRMWKSIRSLFPRLNLVHAPILGISASLFFLSCRISEQSSQVNTNIVAWDPTSVFKTNVEQGYLLRSKEDFALVQFDSLPCAINDDSKKAEEPLLLTWNLSLQSPFGVHPVSLSFSPDSKVIEASLDQQKISIDSELSISRDVIASVCEQLKPSQRTAQDSSGQIQTALQSWLGDIAPDCQISPSNKGFRCEAAQIDPGATEEALNDIRKTMVRSWSRQPYIITRRLSVSVNLAQALATDDPSRQLDTICRAIAHADPVELPLALANRRWQEVVCFQAGASRLEAANLGLNKSLLEIEYLRQLFERTSKLGTLTVRVPKELAPTRDLWVNLIPSADVVKQLANESDEVDSATTTKAKTANETIQGCWHPVFGSDPGSMSIARHLELTGEASSRVRCEPLSLSPIPTTSAPSLYLADSIASETEFVITNGQSKMLRLPAGSYTYEVRGHYETLGWEANADDRKSTGEIIWSTKRPSATIKTW